MMRGFDNPISVFPAKLFGRKMKIVVSNARVERVSSINNAYGIIPDTKGSNVFIHVINPWNKRDTLQSYMYRVIDAEFGVVVANKKGGLIHKNELTVQLAVFAKYKGECMSWPYSFSSPVLSYNCTVLKSDNTYKTFNIEGELITEPLREEFKKLEKGEKVIFSDVTAQILKPTKLVDILLFEVE